ncbi:MAG: hypothetical protein QY325_16160 [Flavobacteriales bacterium]|nr:MAG: hypothetical protein QY325_16160 [Flavobacteriales bacterium]
MRHLLFLLGLLGVLSELSAQRIYQRKRPDIIPLEGQAKRIGWFIAPGITYTLPRFKDSEEEVWRTDTLRYRATYDPKGKVGLYLEAGATWFTRDPVVVDYFDLGLAYKNLRGAEALAGVWMRGDTAAPIAAEGDFAERFLTLAVNANKFFQTGNYQFIQLSLGANADWRLGSSYSHTGGALFNRHAFPPDLVTQLHMKLGYGFKVTGRMLVIPAVESPVFSFTPADEGFGRLQWFSSRYRPLILSVRFLFLRARSGFDCPPPIKHNEFERGRQKTYKPDSYHP